VREKDQGAELLQESAQLAGAGAIRGLDAGYRRSDMEAAVEGVVGGPQRFRMAEAKPPIIDAFCDDGTRLPCG
jgi:hypothetical protein